MTYGAKVAVLLLVLGAAAAAQSIRVCTPNPDIGVDTLDARAKAQRATLDQFKVFTISSSPTALSGTASNRNGLGATVRVAAGGRVLTQWNDGQSGYLSQSVLPLYFGLRGDTTVDRVEVDWPSGRKQVITAGLSSNTTLRVIEPREPR